MFGAIQRVISGGDVASQGRPRETQTDLNNEMTFDGMPTSSVDIRASTSVENDCSMHTPSSSLSDMSMGRREQDTLNTDSPEISKSPTISHIIPMVGASSPMQDDAEREAMMIHKGLIPMETQIQMPLDSRITPMLIRKDSRVSSDSSSATSMKAASSQNSSRDWGWFEDVHESQNSQTQNSHHRRKSGSSGNKKKARLVPSAEMISSSSDGLVESILQKQKSHHPGMFT